MFSLHRPVRSDKTRVPTTFGAMLVGETVYGKTLGSQKDELYIRTMSGWTRFDTEMTSWALHLGGHSIAFAMPGACYVNLNIHMKEVHSCD